MAALRVLKPRPGHHHSGAYAATSAGVTVSHVRGGLLVPGGYEAYSRLLSETVERMVKLNAGQSEDDPDSFSI